MQHGFTGVDYLPGRSMLPHADIEPVVLLENALNASSTHTAAETAGSCTPLGCTPRF